MNTPTSFAFFVVCVLVFFLFALLFRPIRGVFKLLLHSAAGWVGLYICNYVFAFAHFTIGINIASATIFGVLGVPGLILMILAKGLLAF